MNRSTIASFLIAFLVGLVVASAYFFFDSNSRKTQKKNIESIEVKIKKVSKVVPLKTSKIADVEIAGVRPPNKKIIFQETVKGGIGSLKERMKQIASEGLVEFEVNDDGLAIAFGDVILGEVDTFGDSMPKRGFNEVPGPRLWEGGEIPYIIEQGLPNKKEIEIAVEYFNNNTAVRFVPFGGQEDLIVFKGGNENCYSYLGRVGGAQPIVLAPECGKKEIMHEMMHAIGFIHEHSRFDRDAFVEIIWENIKPEYVSQFQLAPENLMVLILGSEFDYNSIMLYPKSTFSKDKKAFTLISKTADEIDPSEQCLSVGDIEKIYRNYGE